MNFIRVCIFYVMFYRTKQLVMPTTMLKCTENGPIDLLGLGFGQTFRACFYSLEGFHRQ